MPLRDAADEALRQKVEWAYRQAESEHRTFRHHAEHFYSLYRGVQEFRRNLRQARPSDRDEVIHEGRKTWGAELFIPFAYSTVETIVPMMVSLRPRMIVVPRDEQALGNVSNMKLIVDAQQKQIDYETVLQLIGKDGLIYGLGVGKTRWKFETRLQTTVVPKGSDPVTGATSEWAEGPPVKTVMFDDAIAERVDPFDFLWDPMGDSMDNVGYVIHRLWRSDAYVKRMVEAGVWRSQENDPDCEWTLEDLVKGSATTKRSEVWDSRLASEGYSNYDARDQRLHEIWEHHDGSQVITVIDNAYPVSAGANPSGIARMPFQIYRPTIMGGRLPGISEIEPIQHLQYEINTLRSQRRDAATLALMRTFAYNETAIDGDDIVLGPGLAIPVNGDPKEFLFPIPIPDLPASSFQESNEIVGDIQRTSGISDPTTGADTGASETATGVQLVQAAATMRVKNKTRLLENSIIVPQGQEFVALNQRRILTARQLVIPTEPDPNAPMVPSWRLKKVTPNELMGRMSAEVEGGSTAPENVPQQRQDAQTFFGLSNDQRLDSQKMLIRGLTLLGVEQPETYLAPSEPQIPISVIEGFMGQSGLNPESFVAYLDQLHAAEQDPNAPPSGPSADAGGGAPSANGAQGAPA